VNSEIGKKIMARIHEGAETTIEIQSGLDLTLLQVQNGMRLLLNHGLVYSEDRKHRNKQDMRVTYYATNPFDVERMRKRRANILDKNTKYYFEERCDFKSERNRPWSKDEMHYGREGQRFTWDDVRIEANMIDYRPNNTELNKSPFIIIEP
jgi:predicted transcriptional regulator